MPELPEVETVCRALAGRVTGRRIASVEVTLPRLVRSPDGPEFHDALVGRRFESVGRRGKFILMHLSGERTLIAHLRMTGRFIDAPDDGSPPPKHTHAVFGLDDGRRLMFNDQRQFGRMRLVETAALSETDELRDLAPEPFGPDFTPESLGATLARSGRPMKDVLLDQTRVLGLGNIYAAEALHRAGISPERAARSLVDPAQIERLHRAIIEVLTEAIAHGGTTIPDGNGEFQSLDGSYGEFHDRLRVYDRPDQPCRTCGTPIRRIVQSGRSTYFCPTCQL